MSNNDKRDKLTNNRTKVQTNNKKTIQKKSFLTKRTLFLQKNMHKSMQYKKYLSPSNTSESTEDEKLESSNEFTGEISAIILPTKNVYYQGKELYYKKAKMSGAKNAARKTKHRTSHTTISPNSKKINHEYKKISIKQAGKDSDTIKQRNSIITENNVHQAGKQKSKLAFSMPKKLDEKNNQSLIKRLKTAISEKLFSPKETASSMKKAICLYALGMLLLVAIPLLLVVAILYNSPFAMFLPTASNEETLMTVTKAYISEFNQEINELAQNPSDCESGRIVYNNYEGDSIAPRNYYDIMFVYMVRYGVGNMASIMNDTSKKNLRQVFEEMCTYKTKVKTEKLEEDGKESTQNVLTIKVTLKTYRDMIEDYKFTEGEINLLETLMSPEYLSLLGATSGGGSEGGFSNEQFEAVISGLTDKDIKTVLNFALSKLDYPYSQPYRDSGKYYDCSSLIYYSWLTVGVNLSYEGANTAAQQAKLCNDLGYTVSYEEMQPGDLIFYSFGYNGRYKNVGHVAMYCGNGMLVDASYSKQKVVYRQVYSKENIVLIGRPKGK